MSCECSYKSIAECGFGRLSLRGLIHDHLDKFHREHKELVHDCLFLYFLYSVIYIVCIMALERGLVPRPCLFYFCLAFGIDVRDKELRVHGLYIGDQDRFSRYKSALLRDK